MTHQISSSRGDDTAILNGPSRIDDLEISASYRRLLGRAIDILKDFGCTEIYVFGSLAHGSPDDASDLDLAVKGCPRRSFFGAVGSLMKALGRQVDLVDLDSADPFARFLEMERELVQVA